ncbi:CsgG/HfaB family protein [Thermatribacter velox]|uniref:CsgG/HfaB family protein n=1 Tax=Thermatribacter velox TaxID=3039681 RepID=A0ABZ2YEW4_9BACT
MLCKRAHFLLLIAFLIFSFASFANAEVKPKVVVVGFDITVPGFQYEETLPNALTDLMIDSLINSGRFRVFERRKLSSLVTEQSFQHFSGLVDTQTAVQLGRMVGAHYVITGSITDISKSGGGGLRLGSVSLGKSSIRATLTVRIVDVTTGEILYSAVKQKKASRSKVGLGFGDVSMYSDSSLSVISAVKELCDEIVADFVSKIDEGIGELADIPLEGYVVESSGKTAYLNLGEATGIKVGSRVRIFKPGKSIVDPKTGETLDQELIPVAEGMVAEVRDRVSKVFLTQAREPVNKEYTVKVLSGEEAESVEFSERLLTEELTTGESEEVNFEEPVYAEEKQPSEEAVEVEKEETPIEVTSLPDQFEGKEVLVAQELYPGGNKKLEYTYYEVDGKQVYHGLFTKWYENGKVRIQGTYRDGKKDGVWKEYFINGVLKSEGTYANGLKEGKWIIYYGSGHKHWEGNYHQNLKEGLWVEYANTSGEKKFAEVEYKAGKEVPGTYVEYDAYGNVVKRK